MRTPSNHKATGDPHVQQNPAVAHELTSPTKLSEAQPRLRLLIISEARLWLLTGMFALSVSWLKLGTLEAF